MKAAHPLEKTEKRGRPRKDDQKMLNGMFWIARSGAQWRELPEAYDPWQSVYARFANCHGNIFYIFPLVYGCFYSISFAFRHSLQTGFPYIPRLSVADYVVRNPCGTWSSSPEAILFQAKKVVKFESGCLKPTVNSGEVSSDELHLRLQ